MSQKNAAILLGLFCFALAACDSAPTSDLTAPEAVTSEATGAATTTTTALAFAQVSAGDLHTCGVTTDNRAYCWGWNVFAQIGDGSTQNGPNGRRRPVLVAGGLRFRQISAGWYSTCGVTTDNRAYCWGHNGEGELGDGTTTRRTTPMAVAGGHLFRQVSVGESHTCGVTTGDRAFCWGFNTAGQLGDGTQDHTGNGRLTPVAVAGMLRFREVSAGPDHTCGVTINDRAYCWGSNAHGEIGDGSEVALRVKPILVARDFRFRQVSAGGGVGPGELGGQDGGRTCGVTTDDRAFCWGDGSHGQIGNGTTSLTNRPRLVAGGLRFRSVSAGVWQTCGATTSNRAYCWGWNNFGELGDGTTTMRVRPVAVAGGHLFSQVTAGGGRSCGKTPGNVGYCWGDNSGGGLGDGTTTNRLRPRPVTGPM